MKNRELLESTQPIVMRTLMNSFSEHKTSHAYLISGQKGSPTKEMAYFIAESLLCENPNPGACEECLTCHRIQDGSYTDFKFFDGSKGEMLKNDVINLQFDFSQSAIEKKGIKVYIVHLIEFANGSVLNSLLKFVEEPAENVVAIFTTENISQVLPTLISRCQVLHLRNFEKKELQVKLMAENISSEDAAILTETYSNLEDALNAYQNTNYIQIKDLVIDTLRMMVEDYDKLNFFAIHDVIPAVCGRGKQQLSCQLYLDLLGTSLKDVLKLGLGQELIFKDQEELIRQVMLLNLPIDKFITNIMLNEGKLKKVVNSALVIDTIFIYFKNKGVQEYAK